MAGISGHAKAEQRRVTAELLSSGLYIGGCLAYGRSRCKRSESPAFQSDGEPMQQHDQKSDRVQTVAAPRHLSEDGSFLKTLWHGNIYDHRCQFPEIWEGTERHGGKPGQDEVMKARKFRPASEGRGPKYRVPDNLEKRSRVPISGLGREKMSKGI